MYSDPSPPWCSLILQIDVWMHIPRVILRLHREFTAHRKIDIPLFPEPTLSAPFRKGGMPRSDFYPSFIGGIHLVGGRSASEIGRTCGFHTVAIYLRRYSMLFYTWIPYKFPRGMLFFNFGVISLGYFARLKNGKPSLEIGPSVGRRKAA